MFIGANVFAHGREDDAVAQTAPGIVIEPGNVGDVDASTDLGACDFDGDNKCDVSADGVIYPGGKPKSLPVTPVQLGGRVSSRTR